MQFSIAETEMLSDKLKGMTIVISGTFDNFSREEIKKLIEIHGGKNISAISKNVDLFVTGQNIGPSKLEKATALGIKMIDENQFLQLIND